MIPSVSTKRGARRRVSQNKSSGRRGVGKSSNDMLIAISHPGVQSASRVRDMQDYQRSNLSTLISPSMKPPLDIAKKVHWFQCSVLLAQGQSISTTAPTELNYHFTITDVIDAGPAIQGLFDQYCIYAVVLNQVVSQVSTASNSLGRVTTALDYDNVNALGSESLLLSYGSAQTIEVVPGLGIQRFIKPCVDPVIYSVQNGVGRLWIDSASTPYHYGIRSYWAGNTSSNLLVDTLCTYIICARNNI